MALLFKNTKVTRSDISFSEFHRIVTLRLKTSNTNVKSTEVVIVIGETHKLNCHLTSFCELFFRSQVSLICHCSAKVRKNSVVNA